MEDFQIEIAKLREHDAVMNVQHGYVMKSLGEINASINKLTEKVDAMHADLQAFKLTTSLSSQKLEERVSLIYRIGGLISTVLASVSAYILHDLLGK